MQKMEQKLISISVKGRSSHDFTHDLEKYFIEGWRISSFSISAQSYGHNADAYQIMGVLLERENPCVCEPNCGTIKLP